MQIKLDNKFFLKENQKPLIIAEISGNHNGSKKLFLKHILEAAKNGADLIKIQSYEPSDITLKSKKKDFIINDGLWKKKSLWKLYQKAHTPFSWHKDAFKLAKKLNIILFSSPFSTRAVDLLEKYKVKLYKIASFEITDLNLIDYVAKKNKPIILSTGMASIKEIKKAISVIKKHHNKIILLYCVSGYPTKEKEMNISTINYFKKIFKNYLIGVSDHTDNIYSSLAATSFGAAVIEKHFVISKKIQTTDSKFSIEKNELKNLSLMNKKVFTSIGKPILGLKKNEKMSIKLRRSIFAKKDIKKGEKFAKDNLICLRPKIGLGAENYFNILGKKSKRNFKKDSPIY